MDPSYVNDRIGGGMMECEHLRLFEHGEGRACLIQKFGAFPDPSVCETICKGDPEGYDRAKAESAKIRNVPRCEYLDLTTGSCDDPELTTERCIQLDGKTCRHFVQKAAPCKACGDKV